MRSTYLGGARGTFDTPFSARLQGQGNVSNGGPAVFVGGGNSEIVQLRDDDGDHDEVLKTWRGLRVAFIFS